MDNRYNMRLDHIVSHFQDITGLHSVEMEIDFDTMFKKSNAFWVMTKIKIKIYKAPKYQDDIHIETWPTYAKGIRFGRDYEISNDEEVLVSCSSEWCTLDVDTKRPRRVETVHYPHSMPHKLERSNAGEFVKVKEEINHEDYNYSYQIRFTDIDTNNHTNNLAYIRIILNTFSVDKSSKVEIDEIQISYSNQSFYNDIIDVYKKQTDYGYYIIGMCKENLIFSGVIKEKQ